MLEEGVETLLRQSRVLNYVLCINEWYGIVLLSSSSINCANEHKKEKENRFIWVLENNVLT